MINLRSLMLPLLTLTLAALCSAAPGVSATEQQVKALFVYNISHFVDWPAAAFDTGTEPFVIGVVGSDAFAALLEEVAHDESIEGHPIHVRRLRAGEPAGPVHILFVERSAGPLLEHVLALVKGGSTLTVSDLDDAAQRGAMIQLANINNHIRLRINVDSVRAAGLTVNSNLLRSADIVRTGPRN